MKLTMKFNVKVKLLTMFLVALPAITACDDDEDQQPPSGLNICLTWKDSQNSNDSIKDICVWLHKEDSMFVDEYHFASQQELEQKRHKLATGTYLVLATTNLLPPFTNEFTQAATFTDGSRHFISLKEANASPEQAYYSVAKVQVVENEPQTVKTPMRKILAELTLTIKGVPEGTIQKCKIENAAAGIYPALKGPNGEYGIPSDVAVPVTMPQAVPTKGMLQTNDFRLMPSVRGATHTEIAMQLIYQNTKKNDFTIYGPPMEIGGNYTIALDFADMAPIMYLNSVKIGEWKEEWTISGEVLNPD